MSTRAEQTTGSEPAPAPAESVAPGRSSAAAWRTSRLNLVWPSVALVLVAIAIWEFYVRWQNVSPSVLPSPSDITQSSWEDRDNLWTALWVTFQETILGLGIAIVAAIVLAVAMDFIPWVRRGIYPILVSSQTIPIVAIAPLVIIWFGFGLMPKVLVVAFYTFFPIVVGLAQGLASTDPDAMNLLRSMRANRWQIFMRARLPSSMPHFFTGVRITVTYAVVAAVFAEYVGSFEGLGIYMQQMRNAFRTDLVFGAVLMTMLLTLLLFLIVVIIERLVMPWHRSTHKDERW